VCPGRFHIANWQLARQFTTSIVALTVRPTVSILFGAVSARRENIFRQTQHKNIDMRSGVQTTMMEPMHETTTSTQKEAGFWNAPQFTQFSYIIDGIFHLEL